MTTLQSYLQLIQNKHLFSNTTMPQCISPSPFFVKILKLHCYVQNLLNNVKPQSRVLRCQNQRVGWNNCMNSQVDATWPPTYYIYCNNFSSCSNFYIYSFFNIISEMIRYIPRKKISNIYVVNRIFSNNNKNIYRIIRILCTCILRYHLTYTRKSKEVFVWLKKIEVNQLPSNCED